MLQIEKQKNNIIFECHQIPENIKKPLEDFLNILKNDDTFLFEINKISPKVEHFEINFLDPRNIQILNNKYRQIDKPTDVLSFNLGYVGEIDLCEKVIREHSEDVKVDFLEEVFRCIIHGCLHIAGYDHKEKLNPDNIESEPMFLLQENILKNVTPSSLPQI